MGLSPDSPRQQCALLVGVALPHIPAWEAQDSLDELARLAATATLRPGERVLQSRKEIHPAFYMGKGKAAELKFLARGCGADLIIFDNDLSPAQMRNVEELSGLRTLDRSGLILDIFALHARTHTAQVQVELAQLTYLLPRLTRMWTHLSRQAGGGAIRGMGAAGVRGPGETQLEIDRRMIRKRIRSLKAKLDRIGTQLATSRKSRGDLFKVALVGYTNAGKSSLMRALSGAAVLVQDQLFATLDSTTRTVELNRGKVLLTDTVGFIRRLPHHLFASFRATLEEAAVADLLLHVVDLSHPYYESQIETVEKVLRDLQFKPKSTLLVYNKFDQVECGEAGNESPIHSEKVVTVSALTGFGIDLLKEKIEEVRLSDSITLDLQIPQQEGRLLSRLRAQGEVLAQDFHNDEVLLRLRLDKTWVERWQLHRFAPALGRARQ